MNADLIEFILCLCLINQKVWDASETIGVELLFETVRLQDFSDLLDSQLVIIHDLHVFIEVMQLTITRSEINRHRHIYVPAGFEIINEARHLCYLERLEYNCTGDYRLGLLIDEFTALVLVLLHLADDLIARQLDLAVEQRLLVSLAL